MSTHDADGNSTINTEVETPAVDEPSTDVSTQETPEDNLPKSNSVAKVLAKKNEAEKRAKEAESAVEQLSTEFKQFKEESQKKEFFARYPQASEVSDEIEAYMESKNVGMEDAYKLLVADDPQLRAKLTQSDPFVGNQPSPTKEDTKLSDLSIDEHRQALKLREDQFRKALR